MICRYRRMQKILAQFWFLEVIFTFFMMLFLSTRLDANPQHALSGSNEFLSREKVTAFGLGNVLCGQILSDDRTMLLLSDRGIYFQDMERGEILRFWPLPEMVIVPGDIIAKIDLSPDGTRLLSVIEYEYLPGKIKTRLDIWNVVDGVIERTLGTPDDVVLDAVFSNDSQLVYGTRNTSKDQFALKVWDVNTGKELRVFPSQCFLSDVVRSPNQNRIFVAMSEEQYNGCDWGVIGDMNVNSGEIARLFKGHTDWIIHLAVSENGKRLLSNSWDNSAIVWNTETGERISTLNHPSNSINPVALSRDGSMAITTGSDFWNDPTTWKGNQIAVWDIDAGKERFTFWDRTANFKSVGFLRDEKIFWALGLNGYYSQWSMETGEEYDSPIDAFSQSLNARFSRDGRQLYFVDRNRFFTFDLDKRETVRHSLCPLMSTGVSAISPDGRCIALPHRENKNAAILVDSASGDVVQYYMGHTGEINCMLFSPDGTRLLTCARDNTLRIWDVYTGESLLRIDRFESQITSAVFSPDGKTVATRVHSVIFLWDSTTGELLNAFYLDVFDEGPVLFSPDGARILICTAGAAKTYSTTSFKNISSGKYFNYYKKAILGAALSSDGKILLTVVQTGEIVFWDYDNGNCLAVYPKPVIMGEENWFHSLVEWAPNRYSFLAFNDRENILRLYEDVDSAWNVTPTPTPTVYSETSTETPIVTPISPSPTAKLTPRPTRIPTPTPNPSPTLNPSPTRTFTPIPVSTSTPTPFILAPQIELSWPDFQVVSRIGNIDRNFFYAIHPQTGDIWYGDNLGELIYSFPSSYSPVVDCSYLPNGWIRFLGADSSECRDACISPDGNLCKLKEESLLYYSSIGVKKEYPFSKVADGVTYRGVSCLFVAKDSRIFGAETGDVILLLQVGETSRSVLMKWSPKNKQLTSLLDSNDLPQNCLEDMCWGPGGSLYLLSNQLTKLYFLDDDGRIQEFCHFILPGTPEEIDYLSVDRSFYLIDRNPGVISLLRFSADDPLNSTEQVIAQKNVIQQIRLRRLAVSMNGTSLFVYHDESHSIQELQYRGDPLPTPTPTGDRSTPTFPAGQSTPTPIGWFVLDGYGGIHSNRPDLQRPDLPYCWNFNIMRDIEPDPMGRGWYMLDGYGGIHPSSPELPVPQSLPYFVGYDIARNLEIRTTSGGLQFYLLDGYGVVHSTDPAFDSSRLPWFGGDYARDLEPDPTGDGWIVMDQWGILHFSKNQMSDIPLHAPMIWIPIAKGFVRFPDQRTVIIDGYGGRHTNPFYPARNLLDGFPADFYFPGWDIIWDVELISSGQ